MLDNNTNKVVWVGVAVGVVTLVSAGAMLLFPQITDGFKPMMRESMLVTHLSASPNSVALGDDKFGAETITVMDNGDVRIHTPDALVANQRFYAVWQTPALTIPSDVTTFTLSATAKGSSKQYANAWVKFRDARGHLIDTSSFVTSIESNELVSDFRTRSISQKIPKGAVTYMLSMEARENSDVTYRDMSIKFN